jgi:hypothetical protein
MLTRHAVVALSNISLLEPLIISDTCSFAQLQKLRELGFDEGHICRAAQATGCCNST